MPANISAYTISSGHKYCFEHNKTSNRLDRQAEEGRCVALPYLGIVVAGKGLITPWLLVVVRPALKISVSNLVLH